MEGKIKELIKLVAQLEELTIRIISLVGWIMILVKLFPYSKYTKLLSKMQP